MGWEVGYLWIDGWMDGWMDEFIMGFINADIEYIR